MAYVVQDITTTPNSKSYSFTAISAFACFFEGGKMMGKSFQVDEPQGLPSIEVCYPSEILDFITLQINFLKFTSGSIMISCRSIEDTYIDLLRKVQIREDKQLWVIGPLTSRRVDDSKNSDRQHRCLDWLDKQAPHSVLYVSFGTTTSMTDQRIKELTMGLEQSGQKFIWVSRDADKGDIFAGNVKRAEALPEGYEE
ncbi:hypothetical protein ACSBR1_034786 [Camellia fascicularis]